MKIDYNIDKTLNYTHIALVILYLILPFGCIWALNTLFGMTIEYSFTNYVAIIVLNMFFSTPIKIKAKS